MKNSFRHGIIRCQTSYNNLPAFLRRTSSGEYVDLIVSPDKTLITISHQETDYLFEELNTTNSAWGPFTAGVDYWLYWDINLTTGLRTFGHTTVEPIVSPRYSLSDTLLDQHWYDSTNNVMKYWNGSSWVECLRVFAGKYEDGTNIIPNDVGSQVNVSAGDYYPGYILFDENEKPLKRATSAGRSRFVTTESKIFSQGSSIVNVNIENQTTFAKSLVNIPQFCLVAYAGYDTITIASTSEFERPVVGIVREDLSANEHGSFITYGYVTNPDWEFNVPAGTTVYLGFNGTVVTEPPNTGLIQPVGYIVDKDTILFTITNSFVYSSYDASQQPLPLSYDLVTGRFIVSGRQTNEFTDVVIRVSSEFPTDPSQGQLCYALNNTQYYDGMYIYTDNMWRSVSTSSSTGGNQIIITTDGNIVKTISGDIVNLALSNTGVTPGTYNNVTVDEFGRVTSGSVTTTVIADKLATARTINFTGDVTGSTSFDGSHNVTAVLDVLNADKLSTPRTINVTGGATGSAVFDGSSDIDINLSSVTVDKLSVPRTISISGDAAGSALFDGSSNVNIGLAVSKAGKISTPRIISISGDAVGSTMFDGSSDVDITLDVTSADKLSIPRTIELTGDITGTVTFDGSSDVFMATTSNITQTTELALLTDVEPTITPVNGSVLTWDGSKWDTNIGVDLNNNSLTRPSLVNYAEKLNTNYTIIDGILTIDLAYGNTIVVNMTANIVDIQIINSIGWQVDMLYSATIIFRQHGTTPFTLNWPNSIYWDSGIDPILTQQLNGIDVYNIISYDPNNLWLGFIGAQDMK